MSEFPQQLLHLEACGSPQYLLYLVVAILPISTGLFFKKRFPLYEALVGLALIILVLAGKTANQLVSSLAYVVRQVILVFPYKAYRERHNHKWIFCLWVFLSTLPLAWTKLTSSMTIGDHQSLFGFLGTSYLTFRAVGMIMETRGGVLSEFIMQKFLRFLFFIPTLSNGSIDRFKRFSEDYENIPEEAEPLSMLEENVCYLVLGFLYKFILAYVFGSLLLPQLKECALQMGGMPNIATLGVIYTYGFDPSSNFTGYSMFVLATSNLMSIKGPVNFNQPFKSRDLKEFRNRWRMSLSFQFRDLVFMRLVKVLVKHKVFKSRDVISSVAYVANMLIMGFWHRLTWYCITYGLFHSIGPVISDAWVRKKKKINRGRKMQDSPFLPDSK